MVATRSKTRTSTGAEEHQPKIDDALQNATTGRKRRSSKATKADGDAGASKKEPKTKKRKTDETSGEKQDNVEVEKQDDGKEVIALENANGAGAVEGKEQAEANGEEPSTEASQGAEHVEPAQKEENHDMAIDSSRVDLDNQVESANDEKTADTAEAANEDKDADAVEPTKEENPDAVNGQEESTTKKTAGEEKTEDATYEEKPEEKATGATDTQGVKEAEKELVQNDSVTEYGTIHFLYKPKVETLHPSSVDDVQRLHIILQPHKQDDPSGKPVLSRMLHIGRKVLPASGKGRRQPFWAFVSAVAEDVGELHDALKESKNDTKTRGVRTTGADRLIASGPYCIVSQPANASGSNPDRRTSFLCYATTLPREPGEVQKAFNIDAEGSFTISVKNPSFGDPPRAGLKEKADYPEELQSQMGSLRWHAVDPPTYLDYPNAELLFIASHGDDIAHDAGEAIAHELEKIADEGDVTDVPEDEMHKIEHSIQKSIFDMLKARGTKNVVEGEESLIEGTWV